MGSSYSLGGSWENRRSRPEQKRGIFKFSQTLSKNFIRLLIFLLLAPCWIWAANKETKLPKTGYSFIRKSYAVIHAHIPESYHPSKTYPLLIALHYDSGNGGEFLPLFQTDAEKSQWIVACPDSENHYSWNTSDFSNQRNIFILKKTLQEMKKRYSVDDKQIYLLGHGTSARFLLFQLLKDPTFIHTLSGMIISASEIQTEMENRLWKKKSRDRFLPILYLYSRDNPLIPYQRVQWTVVELRKTGFPVHYIEEAAYGDAYPSHLNSEIFSWASEKTFQDDIRSAPKRSTIYINHEFEILTFRESVFPTLDFKATANDKTTGSLKNITTYQVCFKAAKSLDQPKKQKWDTIKAFKNIRLEFKTFDSEKRVTFSDIFTFYGLGPMEKSRRVYAQKTYGNVFDKNDPQYDRSTSLLSGEIVTQYFNVPQNRAQNYAAILIYKDSDLTALRMIPADTDSSQFEALSHIGPVKK